MMKVVLVDDQALVQQGIATLLSLTGEVSVAASFASGDALLSAFASSGQPATFAEGSTTTVSDSDLVLLDFHMPGRDGLETLRRLRKISAIPVVFLSTFADAALSREARRTGSQGWLAKSIDVTELIEHLHCVTRGETVFPALTSARTHDDLTAREFEVARCLVAGMTNQQIADRCYLSLGTVKNYTSNLFAKLEVANRTQAISALRARGIS